MANVHSPCIKILEERGKSCWCGNLRQSGISSPLVCFDKNICWKNLHTNYWLLVCHHRGLWNIDCQRCGVILRMLIRSGMLGPHNWIVIVYHWRVYVQQCKVQIFLLPTSSRRLNLGQRLSLSWFGLSSELSDPEAWSCIDLASYCHGAVRHWLLFTTWWYCCISNKRVCSRNIISKRLPLRNVI